MGNEFDKRIKNIEQELTDLKTASEYSSIRSAAITYSQLVYTGTYRITYENRGEPVFSLVHTGIISDEEELGGAMAHTPEGNTQIVEVFTSYMDGQQHEVVKYTTMVVVSNVAVTKIENIT